MKSKKEIAVVPVGVMAGGSGPGEPVGSFALPCFTVVHGPNVAPSASRSGSPVGSPSECLTPSPHSGPDESQ